MKPIAAIALLSLRVALRSRMVLALLALLAAAVAILPVVVRGDGTIEGRLHVLVAYPAAAAMVILGLATLWAGCAVFAGEIEAGRLQLTCVRPVRTLEIWWGQWCGLMLLNILLLGLVLLGIHLGVWFALRDVPSPVAARLRQPFEVVGPALLSPDEAARNLVERWHAEGHIPADLPVREQHRLARRALQAHQPLDPGDEIRLPFRLPRALPSDAATLGLRLAVASHGSLRRRVTGRLGVRDVRSGEVRVIEVDTVLLDRQPFEIPVSGLAGATRLEAFFAYHPAEEGGAILLHPRDALAILLPRGPAGLHSVRTALVLLSLLSLLAGVGITSGALFSHSVAAFFAPAALLITLVGRFVAVQGPWWEADAPGWTDQLSLWVVRGVARITDPVAGFSPVRRLAELEWYPAGRLLQAIGVRGVLYPLALALVAMLVMRRREVAR